MSYGSLKNHEHSKLEIENSIDEFQKFLLLQKTERESYTS